MPLVVEVLDYPSVELSANPLVVLSPVKGSSLPPPTCFGLERCAHGFVFAEDESIPPVGTGRQMERRVGLASVVVLGIESVGCGFVVVKDEASRVLVGGQKDGRADPVPGVLDGE